MPDSMSEFNPKGNDSPRNWSEKLPGGQATDVKKFQIGGPTQLAGSEMHTVGEPQAKSELVGSELTTPQSVQTEKNIGPSQAEINKFTSLSEAPTDLLGGDEDENQRNKEMEAGFINERLSYEARYAKQDRLLHRLTVAETPQDIAPCLEALRKFEDHDIAEGINQYRFQNMIGQALDNADAHGLSFDELIDLGVVDGSIDENGYVVDGGRVRPVGLGYIIRVDEEVVKVPVEVEKGKYKKGPDGKPIEEESWIEWEVRSQVVEKPCFLSESERFALAEANRQLAMQMIIGQKQHTETSIFDANRAALEEQVKIMYLKQIGLTNTQFKEFFTAADISKITPENKHNEEVGERRSKAMLLMRLVGHSETKEKLEKYLNTTFALESILDNKTITQVLKVAGISLTKISGETEEQYSARRFERAAKFLIGDSLKINEVIRTTKDGQKVKVKQYSIEGWLSVQERDVATDVFQNEEHKRAHLEKGAKGSDAVRYERDVLKVRAFLTNDGNVMSRGEKDLQYSMLKKLALIIGDRFAVRDADRMFWTRGEKDELGPEIYAFKYKLKVDKKGKSIEGDYELDDKGNLIPLLDDEGNFIPNLPTGEELVDKWNELPNYDEWQKWGRTILKRFSLPGEPVGSDLSKLFWTYLYRLKDQLNERPTGLLLSTDKYQRLSQSLLSLARTSIKTAYLDERGEVLRDETTGKVIEVEASRSLREQWEGFKGDEFLAIEMPIDMGKLEWEKVRTPEEVEEIVVSERREAGSVEDHAAADSKLWKAFGVSDDQKQSILQEYGGSEKRALAALMGKSYAVDDGGIGDNADGFYKLLNYLAGDGNFEKRPWAYSTNAKIDPAAYEQMDTYTGKIKFLQIIYGAAGAFGNYRKYDRQLVKLRRGGDTKKTTRDLLREEADRNVDAGKKNHYLSIRSHPSYPVWASKEVNYVDGNGQPQIMKWYEFVEEMAVKYGFLNKEMMRDSTRTMKRMKVINR